MAEKKLQQKNERSPRMIDATACPGVGNGDEVIGPLYAGRYAGSVCAACGVCGGVSDDIWPPGPMGGGVAGCVACGTRKACPHSHSTTESGAMPVTSLTWEHLGQITFMQSSHYCFSCCLAFSFFYRRFKSKVECFHFGPSCLFHCLTQCRHLLNMRRIETLY